jgi:hypothetical protein
MARIDFRKELRKIEEMIRQDRIRAEETRLKIDALVLQIQKHYDETKDSSKVNPKNKS